MRPVFYLSYSDNPELDGFVFPSELQSDTYSPGIWIVDSKPFAQLQDEYEFDAVEENKLQILQLIKVTNNLYHVKTDKFGIFFFRINLISQQTLNYVGKSELLSHKNWLYQVTSTDVQKLERICEVNSFFFVGRYDKNIK